MRRWQARVPELSSLDPCLISYCILQPTVCWSWKQTRRKQLVHSEKELADSHSFSSFRLNPGTTLSLSFLFCQMAPGDLSHWSNVGHPSRALKERNSFFRNFEIGTLEFLIIGAKMCPRLTWIYRLPRNYQVLSLFTTHHSLGYIIIVQHSA